MRVPRAPGVCERGGLTFEVSNDGNRIGDQEFPVKKGKTAIVIGAQCGDEGKGKIVDVLSEKFSVVARYAGGDKDGQRPFIVGQRAAVRHVPSGCLPQGWRCMD